MGEYLISGGFPLNPRGRTGVKGRGEFLYWGPNHAVELVFTRLDSNNEEGIQFISIGNDSNDQYWNFPMVLIN